MFVAKQNIPPLGKCIGVTMMEVAMIILTEYRSGEADIPVNLDNTEPMMYADAVVDSVKQASMKASIFLSREYKA